MPMTVFPSNISILAPGSLLPAITTLPSGSTLTRSKDGFFFGFFKVVSASVLFFAAVAIEGSFFSVFLF